MLMRAAPADVTSRVGPQPPLNERVCIFNTKPIACQLTIIFRKDKVNLVNYKRNLIFWPKYEDGFLNNYNNMWYKYKSKYKSFLIFRPKHEDGFLNIITCDINNKCLLYNRGASRRSSVILTKIIKLSKSHRLGAVSEGMTLTLNLALVCHGPCLLLRGFSFLFE